MCSDFISPYTVHLCQEVHRSWLTLWDMSLPLLVREQRELLTPSLSGSVREGICSLPGWGPRSGTAGYFPGQTTWYLQTLSPTSRLTCILSSGSGRGHLACSSQTDIPPYPSHLSRELATLYKAKSSCELSSVDTSN